MSTEITLSDQTSIEEAAQKFAATAQSLVAGHLSVHTRKAYSQDARQFTRWMDDHKLSINTLTKSDMLQYRRFLSENFAKTTASRKLVVARKLLEEAVERGLLLSNPAHKVPGYANTDDQETPHAALNLPQARQLLAAIDTATNQGKRDYALVMLLLRTGLRRSECAALKMGDLAQEQGHSIAVIRHAKGDKRRKVKLAVEVVRAIEEYLEASDRKSVGPEAPLFVQFRKGDHPQNEGIGGYLIQRVVETYAARAGLNFKLTPHALRATFVTLALEGGAKLHQVQYAVGHADPRTTERYQKRKLNLDDNATDYVRI